MTLPILGRSRPRPARPRAQRAGGPRAVACTVVELTNHYSIRDGRTYRDAVCQHPDGSLWTHYLPTSEEGAA